MVFWSRSDFSAFVRACEKHGRDALAAITAEVEGKTEEEVRAYAVVFWKRYQELGDWEKVRRGGRGDLGVGRGMRGGFLGLLLIQRDGSSICV